MINRFFKVVWHYFDAICLVLAICFLVWGAFLFSFQAGIISIGVALIILGLISEMARGKGGD